MKRARRIIFNGLTVLSLLLCVATVVLWVRSYKILDRIGRDHCWLVRTSGRIDCHVSGLIFISVRGKLEVKRYGGYYEDVSYNDNQVYGPRWDWQGMGPNGAAIRDGSIWQRIGLFIEYWSQPRGEERTAGVPHWLVTIFTLLLPLRALHLLARRLSQGSPGLCAVCGYDLRATPDRCPECGTVQEKVKA